MMASASDAGASIYLHFLSINWEKSTMRCNKWLLRVVSSWYPYGTKNIVNVLNPRERGVEHGTDDFTVRDRGRAADYARESYVGYRDREKHHGNIRVSRDFAKLYKFSRELFAFSAVYLGSDRCGRAGFRSMVGCG